MRDGEWEVQGGRPPPAGGWTPESPGDRSPGAAGTVRDSAYVAAGTALARITGVVRVVAIGAVLGPTFLGNLYLVTNALPNLIYYGFLAGSMVSTLLVPMLVRHVDTNRPESAARVSGGLLGIVFAATLLLLPLAVLGLPALMAAAQQVSGSPSGAAVDQMGSARLLVLMTVPQVFLYAVAGTGSAVLYANRRFVLGAVGPAMENIGVVCVLGLVAIRYGVHTADADHVPAGELLMLGLGSTAAVAAYAGLQWWGAKRCGVVLRPRLGWREPELRTVIRRALHALAQAALLALQTLALLVVASTVAGGAVALQIALNFYALPIALVATPIGLALLPRLARLHHAEDHAGFLDAFTRGLMLALVLAGPAAVGYVALAGAAAHAVAVGQLATPSGYAMVSGALAALALGLVGQTAFFIATQASFARDDARAPLRSMAIQTGLCLILCTAALLLVDGTRLPAAVGGAYAVASLVGACLLVFHVVDGSAQVLRALGRSLGRVILCAAAMMLPIRLVVAASLNAVAGRPGWILALIAGSVVGLLVYLMAQALLRAPELGWLRTGLRRRPVGSDEVWS